jgi:DNA sulfur modification protein DndE
MHPPLEHIRLSLEARDELIKLKRIIRIDQWNIFCRWAFCLSMADRSRIPNRKIAADSNVEMSWKVFAGQHEDAYLALLLHRCHIDGIEPTPENLAFHLRAHIHRGIFSPRLKICLALDSLGLSR